MDEREQRKNAALAIVIRARDEARYFRLTTRTNDQNMSEHTPITPAAGSTPAAGGPRIPHGIQRAGADVAEHDAERAQRQGQLGAAVRVHGRAVLMGGGRVRSSAGWRWEFPQ